MTKTSLFVILALMAAVFPAWAEDWTTTDGKTYKGVTVVKIEADAVTILDDEGGALVPLAKLPPDIQKKLGYDPVKAKAAAEQRAAGDKANAAALQAETSQDEAQKQAKIATQDEADAKTKHIAAMQKTAKQFPVMVRQVLTDGLLCETQSITSVSSFNVASYEGTGKLIFVQASPEGMAEGNMISVNAFQDGIYTYTDTQGASRTVEKWVGSVKPTN